MLLLAIVKGNYGIDALGVFGLVEAAYAIWLDLQ